MTGVPSPPRALVPALALLTSITAVVSSLGAPLVPSVAETYDVRLTTAQWSLTATLLAGAVSTPVLGRLATGRLRRPTILIGLGVVTVGAALSAAAAALGADFVLGLELLIAGRALQGVGMALLPLAIAVARDELAGEHMVRTIALLSVTTVAGAGLGYPVTALVVSAGGLTAAYLLGVLLTSSTLVLAWRSVPSVSTARLMHVDWVGAALLSGGMLCLLLGASEGEVWGWLSTRLLGLMVVGLLTGSGWVAWTLRSSSPLVDLRLAARPGIAAPNLVAAVAGVGMYSLLTMAVVMVRTDDPGFGLGRSVVVAGLVLVPYSLMSVLGSRLARGVRTRAGTRALLPIGCTIFLIAMLCLAILHDYLWHAMLAMALGGVGSGFTFSTLAVLIVPHVPKAETSSALAFNQVLRYLGFTVGSAASPALMAAFGGGSGGFKGALLVASSLWLVAGVGAVVLDRVPPTPPTAPDRTAAG